MNKKTLFLILMAVTALPTVVLAAKTAPEMADAVKDIAVLIGAAIVVIGWVVAGILYLMSRGDPSKMKIAKDALVACVVGTILVIIATGGYAVIEGLVKSVTG